MKDAVRRIALVFLLVCAVVLGSCSSGSRVEVIETKGGGKKVRVAVSDEVTDFAREFLDSIPGEKDFSIEYFETHSVPSVNHIRKGEADLAVVSRRLNISDEDDLIYVPFSYGGLVFVCDGKAGVRKLTRRQLAGILSGRVSNWKDVGGTNLPVTVIERPSHSSSRKMVDKFAGTSQQREKKKARVFFAETNNAAVEATRRLSGFIAYITVVSPQTGNYSGIPLEIDGMKPLLSNVPHGSYPIPFEISIVARKNPSPEVNELIEYAFSSPGIHRIAALGLIPASTSVRMGDCHCRGVDAIKMPRKGVKKGILTIGIVPEFSLSRQEARYRRLAGYLAERLRFGVRLKHFESYERLVDEFRKGRLDGAFVGSFVYGVLRRDMGVVPVARPLTAGKAEYRGILMVRKDSGLKRFEDLKGKRVAYVPNTTAGELFMTTLLKEKEKTPSAYFEKVFPVLSHEDAVEMLVSGDVDASFVKDLVFERIIKRHPKMEEEIVVIEVSEAVPENALVLSRESFDMVGKEIRDFLLHLPETLEGSESLQALGAEKFVSTSDEDYENLYAMMKAAGMR